MMVLGKDSHSVYYVQVVRVVHSIFNGGNNLPFILFSRYQNAHLNT